ncbi:MAG: bifunctional demethylmenaquinone methyltransferase/2-methoxy-6-polyprenyl-1,4-benzoquinol methylase UbiE [Bdellovibrionaceae bacterium]|nr:bifunctional demethylmenaquinone methyltransferase/2-methoxy-6-polyprenyl-1,4-benzoquinol methylase UbiE [Pseudobdellovibrionaceae bacterium]
MKSNAYQGPNPEKIRRMFSDISSRYDLANTVLSAGIHHLWRRKLVRWSDVGPGSRVLDCATGTGDLAIEFKKVVGSGEVVGTDFCAEMLIPAPAKAQAAGLDIRFETADVTHLAYQDAQFDAASISFGIRNVGDPARGLSEMARVVRPGGVVMVLEFGQPNSALISSAYNFYSRKVLPKIGGLVTGHSKAYEYLQDSSALFPCREDFAALMKSTGRFASVEWRPLSLGIAYMYKGVVQSQ